MSDFRIEKSFLRSLFLLAGLFVLVLSLDIGARQYKVNDRVPLDGGGGWDYLVVDPLNGQLFVSHGTEVAVSIVLQCLMQSLQQYNTESRLTKFAKVFC